MSDIKKYVFWLITGSQDLYGEETLRLVDEHSKIIAEKLTADAAIPFDIMFKPVVRNSDEIFATIKAANDADDCAGVITWMHTFSPSKMWIKGLKALSKPYLHLNTQFNRDIPWDSIDMDFMNLNQSAHGDREHGYIGARLRLNRKIVAGYWENDDVKQSIAVWQRAAVGAMESQKVRVLRLGDNMRNVAVTDGDKVEAEEKLGWQIQYYGVGDYIRVVEAVSDAEIDAQMAEYEANYDIDTTNIAAVRYQAREQVALQKFMDSKNFNAFHTNFEDLQQLKQLPGLAVQDLMKNGYGFAGEGDWKTAALARVMKQMSIGLEGGSAFMEDYTYHLEPGNELVLGAHMLEVDPVLAKDKPKIQVHPLGIGDREPPARLVFKANTGKGIVASLVDMGDRLRLVVNDIECVEQVHDMPNLPVAGVLWKPTPNLNVSATAWIMTGAAHHSVLSTALTAEHMHDWARIMDIEFVHISDRTELDALEKELMLNDILWRNR